MRIKEIKVTRPINAEMVSKMTPNDIKKHIRKDLRAVLKRANKDTPNTVIERFPNHKPMHDIIRILFKYIPITCRYMPQPSITGVVCYDTTKYKVTAEEWTTMNEV